MNAAPSPIVKSLQAAFDAQPSISAPQRAAFADFLAQGLPTTRLDAWKYTDLRRLTMKQFQIAQGSNATIPANLLSLTNPILLLFVDGQLRPPAATSGMVIGSHSGSAQSEAFERLNASFAGESISLSVQDNVAIDQPIYIACAWTEANHGVMAHPRFTLSLGRNSKATLIEHHIGANSDANFLNSALHVQVGAGASLEHIRVQEDASQNFNVATLHVDVARSASYLNHQYILGAGLARADISIALTGENSHAELHGLVFARDTQHLDVRTCIDHRVPNTTSKEDYRGIADHRGRVVFNGKVIVAKDAQRTDAAQSSRNLLLSPHAEIDTRPELEIYANDVKCAHGATVGQLDAASLFYLQSRGIAQDEARALLTHAFAAEIIERIPHQSVREQVLARFMARMRTGTPQ